MSGESTTLSTAQEQDELFAATADSSFVFWTKFRLQGRLLWRILICVTAASAKSEFQRKWAESKTSIPSFLRETAQLLIAAAWHYSAISNWKCQYLNLILYETWSNEILKSASLRTDKTILHCTRTVSPFVWLLQNLSPLSLDSSWMPNLLIRGLG